MGGIHEDGGSFDLGRQPQLIFATPRNRGKSYLFCLWGRTFGMVSLATKRDIRCRSVAFAERRRPLAKSKGGYLDKPEGIFRLW